jgi:hypothetical protein
MKLPGILHLAVAVSEYRRQNRMPIDDLLQSQDRQFLVDFDQFCRTHCCGTKRLARAIQHAAEIQALLAAAGDQAHPGNSADVQRHMISINRLAIGMGFDHVLWKGGDLLRPIFVTTNGKEYRLPCPPASPRPTSSSA